MDSNLGVVLQHLNPARTVLMATIIIINNT